MAKGKQQAPETSVQISKKEAFALWSSYRSQGWYVHFAHICSDTSIYIQDRLHTITMFLWNLINLFIAITSLWQPPAQKWKFVYYKVLPLWAEGVFFLTIDYSALQSQWDKSKYLCCSSVQSLWHMSDTIRETSEVKQGMTFSISPVIICSDRSSVHFGGSVPMWLMAVWDPASWEPRGLTVRNIYPCRPRGHHRTTFLPPNMKTLWEGYWPKNCWHGELIWALLSVALLDSVLTVTAIPTPVFQLGSQVFHLPEPPNRY